MRKRPEIDLLLLHPPSVYDFRTKSILYGPVSDMVPSSTVFEMYPIGFLTILSYLRERGGLQVRIVNLALRMMNNRRFDVRSFLARLSVKAVGIDLHWMPHAHGALEVPRVVKEVKFLTSPGRKGIRSGSIRSPWCRGRSTTSMSGPSCSWRWWCGIATSQACFPSTAP